MSTLESSKNPNSDELCETASEAGASSNNTNINAEAPSLEELLNTLHRQIRKSDWLEKNTAEKWMNENPEAAKDLLQIISEKKLLGLAGLGVPLPPRQVPVEAGPAPSKKRCHFCPPRISRTIKQRCGRCKVPVCNEHVNKLCQRCMPVADQAESD